MSPILTGKAPLRIPRRAEVVASAGGWHLAVAHFEPDNRRQPRCYVLDRRRCLELLLAVRRAWWRIAFRGALRGAAPGVRMEGLYVSSELVEVGRDLLGDHVRVFGRKLRSARGVRSFRRGMLASMRLGRRLSAELARNAARLAWPPAAGPAAKPAAAPAPPPRPRRAPGLLPPPLPPLPAPLPPPAATRPAPCAASASHAAAARHLPPPGPATLDLAGEVVRIGPAAERSAAAAATADPERAG